ncbi:hypothetical protein [Phreatobacter stygius]|uniref:Uncharacterized protein n=1 Tax=Phreatobacter stygius TaxID=1940610 RepID=A0A4D7B534_9HYPH|nr:hypothetical protein [Phreatobacter stygius]QCI66113.1 hypothetical protein E8M01_19005 [Phreatobacter stygius]
MLKSRSNSTLLAGALALALAASFSGLAEARGGGGGGGGGGDGNAGFLALEPTISQVNIPPSRARGSGVTAATAEGCVVYYHRYLGPICERGQR